MKKNYDERLIKKMIFLKTPEFEIINEEEDKKEDDGTRLQS